MDGAFWRERFLRKGWGNRIKVSRGSNVFKRKISSSLITQCSPVRFSCHFAIRRERKREREGHEPKVRTRPRQVPLTVARIMATRMAVCPPDMPQCEVMYYKLGAIDAGTEGIYYFPCKHFCVRFELQLLATMLTI